MGSKPPIKLNSVVDASRYVPNTNASSLIVAVRVRPLLRKELTQGSRKDILRVLNDKVVVVLDPDESKDYLDQVQNRTKEKRYTFDVAFDTNARNVDIYNGTVRDLVGGLLHGINTTVFAYGATGSGKTYTMVGTREDPGLMLLSLQRIFIDRVRLFKDEELDVHCSYLEVYNEVIYDLLVKSSAQLELREDPELGVTVAGLRHIHVQSAEDIMDLLEEGNKRRKTESTDANSQSSRSHAVLEIEVCRQPKNHYRVQQLRAKLSLVDLAGSERAAETNNAGQKLRDGANINRSLLALANCINALGKANSGKAASYVPYRNSKLTRLLKDGLSGNSRTAMIATVAAASDQYHHSINTLKYADRAKEIKTHVVQNMGTVESHISDYQRIIDNLQAEVVDLRAALSEQQTVAAVAAASPSSRPRTAEDDLLSIISKLIEEMNENIEERINYQKALFEAEDTLLCNRHELQQLDAFLDQGAGSAKDVVESRDRRSEVIDANKEAERARDRYRAEIADNEAARKDIQGRVQTLVASNQRSQAFLNLLSTFRLQALHLQELKFQMAIRDQVIREQKEVIHNLWRIIDKSGLGRDRVAAIAAQEGILMAGLTGDDPAPGAMGNNGRAGAIVPLSPTAAAAVGDGDGEKAKLRLQYWARAGGSMSASVGASPLHSSDDEGVASSTSDRSPLRGRSKGGAQASAGGARQRGPTSARLAGKHTYEHGDGARGGEPRKSYNGGREHSEGHSLAKRQSYGALGGAVSRLEGGSEGAARKPGGRVDIIRSGRRAGDEDDLSPRSAAARRPSEAGDDVLELAGRRLGGGQGGAGRRRATEASDGGGADRDWGNPAPPPPALVPPQQPPLNERLAKLKLRLKAPAASS